MLNRLSIIKKNLNYKQRIKRYQRYYINEKKLIIITYVAFNGIVKYTFFLKDFEVKKLRLWLNKADYNLLINRIKRMEVYDVSKKRIKNYTFKRG